MNWYQKLTCPTAAIRSTPPPARPAKPAFRPAVALLAAMGPPVLAPGLHRKNHPRLLLPGALNMALVIDVSVTT